MRVLVIDDEPDVLLLCKVNFQFGGHEVLGAPDGERGMELAETARPDLIVLDVMLPNRDGLSVLRELGQRPDTKDTPVVVLTAKAREEEQLQGWRAGAADYVTKPFAPLALRETVERVYGMTPEERRRHRDQAVGKLHRA